LLVSKEVLHRVGIERASEVETLREFAAQRPKAGDLVADLDAFCETRDVESVCDLGDKVGNRAGVPGVAEARDE
jgi:hypothetical protein